MQRYFSHIEALNDISEVLWYAVGVCEKLGAIRQSYYFIPFFESPSSERAVIHAHGYSSDWLKLYDESDFRQKDPIPSRTMKHGALLTWREAQSMGANTPDNLEYFKAMRDFGLIHGFGLPLYGPRGRSAYSTFDFGYPIDRVPEDALGTLRSVAQSAHQRVCVLLDKAHSPVELSLREQEVLQWIVRGKSLSVIADILNLSPETVKTYAKRIYAKLGEKDRIGTIVKALKLGLVTD